MALQLQPNVFSEKYLTEPQAAYIAGLFDGEGSVYLIARKGKRRRSHHFHPEMTLGNTSLRVLEWLVETTGNGAIYRSRSITGANHKPVYRWQLQPSQIRHVLPQIAPYLRLKGRQAALMMEFFVLQQQADRGPSGQSPPAVIERILALHAELRALNHRGLTEIEPLQFSVGEPKERKRTCDEEGCENRRYRSHLYCYQHWLQRREPVLKTCEWCGETMDAILPKKRFCSAKCQWQSSYQRRKHPE